MNAGGQQSRRVVLVDHRFNANKFAGLVLNHRNPPTANADHDEPPLDEIDDHVSLDDALGPRRGHHTPPPSTGIFDNGPSLLLLPLGGNGFLHKGSDWLGGIAEGGITAVHQDLRHHCHRLEIEAPPAELVVQRALEHVADGALGIRAAVVQRHGMKLVKREFGAAEDEAHLRTVAMGYCDIPPALNHARQMRHRFFSRAVLVGNRLAAFVLDKGIPADGHYS